MDSCEGLLWKMDARNHHNNYTLKQYYDHLKGRKCLCGIKMCESLENKPRISPHLYIQRDLVEPYMGFSCVCQPKLSFESNPRYFVLIICLKVPCCCSSVACGHREEMSIKMETVDVGGAIFKPGRETSVLLS